VDNLGTRLTEAEREQALDPLTRLYNRRVLDAALEEAVALKRSYGHKATLLMLDVDHFKKVNDTHGHPAGDAVLKGLADTLVRCFPRRSDVVTRFGGEEFVVLLSDTGQGDAGVAVRRVMDAVHNLVVNHQDLQLQVTVSLGVAEVRVDHTPTAWLEQADTCLYQAKDQGRDRAVVAPHR
jgi:diguanylate cyclase (GGDEF)-like protein